MPPARESGGSGGDSLTQPAMLNLKQFLDTQDENISDSEVMRKYTEYKTDFKRQQLNEFFVAHKDEEWLVSRPSARLNDATGSLLPLSVHLSTLNLPFAPPV